ncbi:MAG: MBL fold metallo-hydrolase [Acidobacteria bacterium]|nr:MBL fold metallo-hydrolase [Acidobacteriota bacterium]MCK6683845.1 MBL fold metallo-hydrolase [Thermoanaerobaculia bacterium]
MIEVSFLASGSSGNCAVIRSGKTAVLLDAGLSPRQIDRRLKKRGMTLADIHTLLLTHEHSDHSGAANTLVEKRGFSVFTTAGTARSCGLPGPLFGNVHLVSGETVFTIGDELEVRAVTTPHDGVEPLCFVFTSRSGERAGIATDLGFLPDSVARALLDCDVLGLEMNHDLDLLRTGPYSARLKARILSDRGHLSNEAGAKGLARVLGPRTKKVALLHLSKQNNTPALALLAARCSLNEIGAQPELVVASPDEPSEWLSAGD